MSVSRGTEVAHSPGGTRHLVRIVLDDGTAACLCGTDIRRPRTARLVGPECTTCRGLRGRDERVRVEEAM